MDEDALIGRARETAEIKRRLAAARAGDGFLMLVEGEAGAGKTALAHWAAGVAKRQGMRVVWGACLEGEGAPAYRPWAQILRGQPAAKLLDPPDSEASGSRFQLFDEVVDSLIARSNPHGLLLVIDDLHWADTASVRLLQALVAQVSDSRMLILVTYRSTPALRDVRLLGRERAASQALLSPLTDAEVAALVGRTLGRTPDEMLLRTVQARSQGNPLFVLELLRLASSSDRYEAGLPGGIREVITQRLDLLAPETRQLLRHTSVLGRQFSPLLLSALVREVPAQVLSRLDAALAAEVLETLGTSELRFTHVLTQEVLYAELPAAQRQALHASAADVLTGGDAIDARAHHLRQAAPLGGAEQALLMTREAAGRAYSQLAYEHAAFLYHEMLGLLSLVPEGKTQRAELLLACARCEFRAGAVEAAWKSCQGAASLGRAAGDAGVVADAAIVLRGITNSPVTAANHELCRQALEMLDGTDPVREARLLAQFAVTADPFANSPGQELSVRAMRAAEATGDPEARFLAMQAHQSALVAPAHALERLSLGERAVGLGSATGNPEYKAWGHVWRMDAFWQLGRRIQLDAELTAFSRLALHLKEPLWTWRLFMIQANLALVEGRFEQARDLAAQALSMGNRGGNETAGFFHLVFSSHLAMQTGQGFEQIEPAVRGFVESGPYLARTWYAEVLAGMGRTEEASAMWATVVPHLSEFPRDSPEWIVATAGSAQMAIQFGSLEIAAAAYAELLPYAGWQATGGAHTPDYGPVTMHLGVLAAALGDAEAAESHLHSALAAAKAFGSPPYEAAVHLELARLRPHDKNLESARRISQRLGMHPLLHKAMELRDRHVAVLSGREEQVAALVAEGLSNRQIAHRLHLSERTAENHVAHVLTKLGFDSRARIASWYAAHRRGN